MDEDIISPRPDPPPLRIHHLMVCAVVAAVQLSLLRFLLSLSQQQTLVANGVFGFTQVLSSVGLTLTGFSIYWRRKGYASFSQPGQMLLIQYAASFVMLLISILIMLAIYGPGGVTSGPPSNASWAWLFPFVLGGGSLLFGVLLPVTFYIWCAWKIADTWPWRWLFILCALTAVLTSTISILLIQMFRNIGPSNLQIVVGTPYVIRGSVLLGAGLVAVVADWMSKWGRSWTHWAGIILWLLGQIGSLLMGLFYIFVWQVK
jgi:hypothetical protein